MRIQSINSANYQNNYQNKNVGFKSNIVGTAKNLCPALLECGSKELLLGAFREAAIASGHIKAENCGDIITLCTDLGEFRLALVDTTTGLPENIKHLDLKSITGKVRAVKAAETAHDTVEIPLNITHRQACAMYNG